MTKVLQAVAPG